MTIGIVIEEVDSEIVHVGVSRSTAACGAAGEFVFAGALDTSDGLRTMQTLARANASADRLCTTCFTKATREQYARYRR